MNIYGKSHVFWAVYGADVDLPAILLKLVGLGYEVARSGFREGRIYLDPLPGGYAGLRRYAEGAVYLLANLDRGAVGVSAEEHGLLIRGMADLSRALGELQMPEPPRAELHVSFAVVGRLREGGGWEVGDVKLYRAGLYAVHGDPQGGEGIFISIGPMGAERYLTYVVVGGRWGYVVSLARRIWDLLAQLLSQVVE